MISEIFSFVHLNKAKLKDRDLSERFVEILIIFKYILFHTFNAPGTYNNNELEFIKTKTKKRISILAPFL